MIQVKGLSKSYHNKALFEDVTFSVGSGERVGLVGRNGSGKSTLLKIITGMEDPDSGTITAPKGYKLGYLDQHIRFTKETLLDECCQVLAPDEQYDHYKAEKILSGLGFTEADFGREPGIFSGGFQLRINLAKTLLQRPDLLLLDEPTNYLDILSLRWLRRFLKSFRGEVIIITHDRDFMDSVTTHTMGIHRGRLVKVKGGTEKYYAQILMAEEVHERTRAKQEKRIKELRSFVERFGAKATKAAQAKSKARQIERMEVLTEMAPEQRLGFRFNYEETHAKTLLEAQGLGFSYTGERKDNLFAGLSFHIRPGDRIGVIGQNGRGKTTLLNILAGVLPPTEGTVKLSPTTLTGYYQQTNRKDLGPGNTVVEEIEKSCPGLTRSGVRAVCGAMMFPGDMAEKKISVLSGGEQSRVLLGKIIANPANLLILDEPSNHLDMDAIEVMREEIGRFPGGVVIVTHDEGILRSLATRLIVFHEARAEVFEGGYDDFLRERGWEEEGPGTPGTRKGRRAKEPGKGKKKAQGRRSDEKEREEKRRLKALTVEYEALEEEIKTLEALLLEKNNEAQRLVQEGGAGAEIEEVYRQIGRTQAGIDEKYAEMEGLLESMDGLKKGA